MKKRYTDEELRALRDIIRQYGHLDYDPDLGGVDLVKEFNSRTGTERNAGPLYMAAWRIEKGTYSHRGISL